MLIRASAQVRVGGASVTGLDLTACLTLGTALGYTARALAELLPHAEAGLVEGLASLDKSDHGDP